jgi:hypothetical protein
MIFLTLEMIRESNHTEFHYNIVETRVSAIESDKDQLQW